MDVAVLLVNWNGRELLPYSLSSLPPQVEIWVVDNGSSDDSVDYLKKEHPHIRLILNKHNRGFGNANNQALTQIKKKYVLMLNTDAQLKKGSLETAIDFLDEHKDVGLVGARLINEDGSLQNSVTHKVDFLSECLNRNFMSLIRGEKRKSYNEPAEVPGVVGAAMLARMTALKEVNYFDEDYFFFFEETDLCLRLTQNQFKVVHHPFFAVTHAQGKSASKNLLLTRIEYHRSRELYFFKHLGRMAAKKLQLWQERRLILAHTCNKFLKIISCGLIKPRKNDLTQHLLNWYRMGCPTDQGLNTTNKDII